MGHRVVIIDMEAICPLGDNFQKILSSIKNANSAARMIDIFPAEGYPSHIGCQIPDDCYSQALHEYSRIGGIHADRKTVLGMVGTERLMRRNCDFICKLPGDSMAISLGVGINSIDFKLLLQYFQSRKAGHLAGFYREMHDKNEYTQIPGDYVANWAAKRYGFHGFMHTNFSACASSTQALGVAFRWISSGKALCVLTGGLDSILNPIGIAGFNLLGTLSARNESPQSASRPFDQDRDGFVPGEGCAFFLLTSYEYAKLCGATIYGEICGYGTSMDSYKVTAPDPEGIGAARAMRGAMAEAGWDTTDVDYINAHGTATKLNDVMETKAIKSVFGRHSYEIFISSCKSQMGHLIASSGAVESAVCLEAIRNGIIPATINLDNPDRDCDLNYVPVKPIKTVVKRFLKNSFALGGQNATLAFYMMS